MVWRKFPAHADTGLVVGVTVLWALIGCSLGWMAVRTSWGQPSMALRWGILIGGATLTFLGLLWAIASPTYALGTHDLLVQIGWFRLRFPYRRIAAVEESDLLAPPRSRLPFWRRMLVPSRLMLCIAAKPLVVHLRWGMFRSAYIAPRERDAFVELLHMRAPDVPIDVPGRPQQT